jgi:beta-glucosidase
VSVPVVADRGSGLAFSATGLPAGTAISAAGLITGTPVAAGTSTVTVTARDDARAFGRVSFTWTVVPRPARPGTSGRWGRA